MNYVYLLRAGENHYKVGVAKSVKSRVSSLQTANPVRIEIVNTKLVDDAYKLEGEMHEYLQNLKSDGGQEWFTLTCEQAIELAIMINRAPEIDISQTIRLRDILAKHDTQARKLESKLDIVLALADSKIQEDLRLMEMKNAAEAVRQREVKQIKESNTDEHLVDLALEVVKKNGRASTSLLQRKLKIGYGRAARVIELMEERGLIGEADGSRAREVLA